MKSINSILLIILLALTGTYSQAQSKDFSREEQEIIKVIKEETQWYLQRDFEKWASYWHHEPFCRHYTSAKTFYTVRNGWEEIVRSLRHHFEGRPMENFDIEKSDFEIEIMGDFALAHHNERYITTKENGEISESLGANNALLKKEDGKWKYLTMNIVYLSSYNESDEVR